MAEDISGQKIVISKALLKNNDGEFLVVKEREDRDKDTAGKWELPGGRLKYGEDQFEAGARELKEEVGLRVNPEKGEDVVRIEVEDDSLVSCYIVYFEEFDGEPVIRVDSHLSEYRWVEADKFIEMDWHSNAGYDIVPMKDLEKYLEKENIY
ncbi:MAG: NUDIX domain-containing protein [Candidatus Nanohaloarchaea archaeon]